ncbi:MAG: MFS transporter, partial [Acidocella sp.]|nr:MFS transporter [Acidocella sp.]
MSSQSVMPALPGGGNSMLHRELAHYPAIGARRFQLGLVVAITVALYYELYVGGGVAPLILGQLQMPFPYFVMILALGNLAGAFASLLAGLTDRMGRANLVVIGLGVVGVLTFFITPNVHSELQYGLVYGTVAFVEGIILVATPALIRDFSPQVGRATAMGFWTVGPVLGSLMVSAVTTLTLPMFGTWQSQFYICGGIGMVIFVIALFALRELAPALRDQIMVSERDRVLVEARAKGLDIEASLRNPWRQMMHVDVLASALGVSLLLLYYFTAVGFGVIYLITVFGYSVAEANSVANWAWGTNAVALIAAGVLSDKFRVRKPFMLGGGIGGIVMMLGYSSLAGTHPSYTMLVVFTSGISIFTGFAYTTWMASFTETVEAHNPALTATGLAVWGWIIRIVVTITFLSLPVVIGSVTPLVEAPYFLGLLHQAMAAHQAPSPALLQQLGIIQAAAKAAPAQWHTWYNYCVGGV